MRHYYRAVVHFAAFTCQFFSKSKAEDMKISLNLSLLGLVLPVLGIPELLGHRSQICTEAGSCNTLRD
jgi:hypothetical protein